jgi:hypothetical protein
MTVVQGMKRDRGFLVPMPLFFHHNPTWSVKDGRHLFQRRLKRKFMES